MRPEEAEQRDEAEDLQPAISRRLYDEYLASVSAALINAPEISEIRFGEYEHVIMLPRREIRYDDLMLCRKRDEFFTRGLNDIITPGLLQCKAMQCSAVQYNAVNMHGHLYTFVTSTRINSNQHASAQPTTTRGLCGMLRVALRMIVNAFCGVAAFGGTTRTFGLG